MNYLIDTDVVSDLVKPRPDKYVTQWIAAVPPESLHMSVLTLSEIRKGIAKIEDIAKREKLRIWLEHELPAWFVDRLLVIDAGVSERWGRLLAKHKKALSAIDSMIAATALHFDLSLVTSNTDDFKAFTELQIINPWIVAQSSLS